MHCVGALHRPLVIVTHSFAAKIAEGWEEHKKSALVPSQEDWNEREGIRKSIK